MSLAPINKQQKQEGDFSILFLNKQRWIPKKVSLNGKSTHILRKYNT